MKKILLLLLLSCFLCHSQDDFILGACSHFSKEKAHIQNTLDMVVATGFESVRDDVVWGAWEYEPGNYKPPGQYDEYARRAYQLGIRPLHLINWGHASLYSTDNKIIAATKDPLPEAYEAYGNFAAWLVARYKPLAKQPNLFQVWNEWSGSADIYVKLIKDAYPKMKAADPDCIVMANSCHRGKAFLEECFKMGMLQACDAFAINTYNPNPANLVEQIREYVELSKQYNNGVPKPVYITECGRPTHFGATTPDQAADYMAQLLLNLRSIPMLKGTWIYNFENSGYDVTYNEHNFGMLHNDLTPKPALMAVKSILPIVAHGSFVRRWETSDDIFLMQYKLADGEDAIAAWTTNPDLNYQIVFKRNDAPDKPVQLAVAGYTPFPRKWGWLEWQRAEDNTFHGLNGFRPDEVAFTFGVRPVILTGSLQGISIAKLTQILRPVLKPARIDYSTTIRNLHTISSDKNPEPVKLNPLDYRQTSNAPRNGDDDLSADFTIRHDYKLVYVTVNVTDDKHVISAESDKPFLGDSLQFAVGNITGLPISNEYTLTLTEDGCQITRTYPVTSKQLDAGIQASASRKGTTTTYQFTFPLPFKVPKGDWKGQTVAFGFAMVVNDNDGEGRKGYLRWGDGIAHGKNMQKFIWEVVK